MRRSKHVEPSINFGIINSITKLHLVVISTESSTLHGSMNIKFRIMSRVTLSKEMLDQYMPCYVAISNLRVQRIVRHYTGEFPKLRSMENKTQSDKEININTLRTVRVI